MKAALKIIGRSFGVKQAVGMYALQRAATSSLLCGVGAVFLFWHTAQPEHY